MAYTDFPITTLAETVNHVNTFATGTLGWTSNFTGTIRSPNGSIDWEYTASDASSPHPHILVTNYADINMRAKSWAPVVDGTQYSPQTKTPERLFLFGTADYLAIVIRFAGGIYRHMYIGVLNKAGNYTNGDIVSSNDFFAKDGTIDSSITRPLFTASDVRPFGLDPFSDYFKNKEDFGCVYLQHTDALRSLWHFYDGRDGTIDSSTDYEPDTVCGGGTLWFEVLRNTSRTSFSGVVPLQTYELFVAHGTVNTDLTLIPIGHPKGVRGCNIQPFNPEEEIVVGAETWKVFPEFRRDPSLSSSPDTGYYPVSEASGYAGIAYRM